MRCQLGRIKKMHLGCDILDWNCIKNSARFLPFGVCCLPLPGLLAESAHVRTRLLLVINFTMIGHLADYLKSSTLVLASITLVSPSLPFTVSSIVSSRHLLPCQLFSGDGKIAIDCMLKTLSESNKNTHVWTKIRCSKLSTNLLISTCTS